MKEHDGTFCAASVPVITNDEDWVAVQKLGDVNLEDFVSIDDNLMTSEIRGVDDMIADHAVAVTTANDDSNEGDETTEENVPTRNKALGAINLLLNHLSCTLTKNSSTEIEIQESGGALASGAEEKLPLLF
ncbi:hypothetical protein C0J52_09585 [Blattella germanica]|nr:hypothetical protein C0J52_09585 [Blattella germanica]